MLYCLILKSGNSTYLWFRFEDLFDNCLILIVIYKCYSIGLNMFITKYCTLLSDFLIIYFTVGHPCFTRFFTYLLIDFFFGCTGYLYSSKMLSFSDPLC